jgi:hypothetical protein
MKIGINLLNNFRLKDFISYKSQISYPKTSVIDLVDIYIYYIQIFCLL